MRSAGEFLCGLQESFCAVCRRDSARLCSRGFGSVLRDFLQDPAGVFYVVMREILLRSSRGVVP